MKFSLFALSALSIAASAAPVDSTSSIEKRDGAPLLQQWLTGLTAEVKPLAAHMTEVTSSLPSNANDDQKKAAASQIMPDITHMTNAVKSTKEKILSVQQHSKRQGQPTLADLPEDVLGQLNGKPIDVANLVLPLLQELNPAVASVLNTLSLGEVNAALQPLLTTELPGLITGLDPLVNGLLAALAPLLSGLGGLLGPLLLGLGL